MHPVPRASVLPKSVNLVTPKYSGEKEVANLGRLQVESGHVNPGLFLPQKQCSPHFSSWG